MKTIFHLCIVAVLSCATVSCTKSHVSKPEAETPAITDPFIYSKIEKSIVQPIEVNLGTVDAVFSPGQTVTIFLPYSVANEAFTSTKITMTDDATGLPINTYDLIPSTDPSASQLTLPASLYNKSNFFFITFVADEAYAGKTVSISTSLEGQVTYSNDELNAAFSVTP